MTVQLIYRILLTTSRSRQVLSLYLAVTQNLQLSRNHRCSSFPRMHLMKTFQNLMICRKHLLTGQGHLKMSQSHLLC